MGNPCMRKADPRGNCVASGSRHVPEVQPSATMNRMHGIKLLLQHATGATVVDRLIPFLGPSHQQTSNQLPRFRQAMLHGKPVHAQG